MLQSKFSCATFAFFMMCAISANTAFIKEDNMSWATIAYWAYAYCATIYYGANTDKMMQSPTSSLLNGLAVIGSPTIIGAAYNNLPLSAVGAAITGLTLGFLLCDYKNGDAEDL